MGAHVSNETKMRQQTPWAPFLSSTSGHVCVLHDASAFLHFREKKEHAAALRRTGVCSQSTAVWHVVIGTRARTGRDVTTLEVVPHVQLILREN
ncbi:unnamed protein product [Chondrus crispus]|uniref:Uncharacterized protein n=1 Tax=Chondrus crispus TaxID=2769 RepID=R7Q1P8_CHOCR|nr:unnamed protein product [Chondrus crispus]CDF32492.1 unnamed protein product [Chondrus crispus]|eukprot:XP_005712157.1 unnamed protein product [Chondrus crispus]